MVCHKQEQWKRPFDSNKLNAKQEVNESRSHSPHLGTAQRVQPFFGEVAKAKIVMSLWALPARCCVWLTVRGELRWLRF
jgi:hypothetical protein